mmetsp:Transcript_67045/g.125267  ORF Transcript_67045/g.125267 Transcript_67045/m.125267 type:complete len:86 (-) Transcript_67045:229-486(-)
MSDAPVSVRYMDVGEIQATGTAAGTLFTEDTRGAAIGCCVATAAATLVSCPVTGVDIAVRRGILRDVERGSTKSRDGGASPLTRA